MKKLIVLFMMIVSSLSYAHRHNRDREIFKNIEMEREMETLTPNQKEKLLVLRQEYFSELKAVQMKFRNLRKEANHCMMNNDEERYEKIHDKMNELKLEREQIKENYRRKIKKILD